MKIKRRLYSPTLDQKRIIIYLHQLDPIIASWTIINEKNEIEQTIIKVDLATFITKPEYAIHVIIPGQDVLLTQTELTITSRARLLQALPYALEDQLIDDIEQLHFAINEEINKKNISVAIIKKSKIEKYLEILKTFNIQPHSLVPLMLTLPLKPGEWSINCDTSICAVRMDLFSGFTCDRMNIDLLLQSKWLEMLEKPQRIEIQNLSDDPLYLNGLPAAEKIISEQQWLQDTALSFGENSFINLLQGNYSPKINPLSAKKIWSAASALMIVWFALLIVNQCVSFFILHNENERLEKNIASIYHQQFPAATSIVAPHERMENAIKNASIAANTNYFLILLSLWSQAFSSTSGLHIAALNYEDNHLNIAVTAPSLEILDQFIDQLHRQGLKVKQQNANIAGSEAKSTLWVTKDRVTDSAALMAFNTNNR